MSLSFRSSVETVSQRDSHRFERTLVLTESMIGRWERI